MRVLSLLLLIALAVGGHQASAQNATGAQITWFGVYTVAKTAEVKDQERTGPRTVENGIVPPTINEDRIVLRPNIRFGFGYTLSGSPAKGREHVAIQWQYPRPGLLQPDIGQMMSSSWIFADCEIGGTHCLVGYAIDDPKGIPVGVWTFRVYGNPKLLAEKNFTVSLP